MFEPPSLAPGVFRNSPQQRRPGQANKGDTGDRFGARPGDVEASTLVDLRRRLTADPGSVVEVLENGVDHLELPPTQDWTGAIFTGGLGCCIATSVEMCDETGKTAVVVSHWTLKAIRRGRSRELLTRKLKDVRGLLGDEVRARGVVTTWEAPGPEIHDFDTREVFGTIHSTIPNCLLRGVVYDEDRPSMLVVKATRTTAGFAVQHFVNKLMVLDSATPSEIVNSSWTHVTPTTANLAAQGLHL